MFYAALMLNLHFIR